MKPYDPNDPNCRWCGNPQSAHPKNPDPAADGCKKFTEAPAPVGKDGSPVVPTETDDAPAALGLSPDAIRAAMHELVEHPAFASAVLDTLSKLKG